MVLRLAGHYQTFVTTRVHDALDLGDGCFRIPIREASHREQAVRSDTRPLDNEIVVSLEGLGLVLRRVVKASVNGNRLWDASGASVFVPDADGNPVRRPLYPDVLQ